MKLGTTIAAAVLATVPFFANAATVENTGVSNLANGGSYVLEDEAAWFWQATSLVGSGTTAYDASFEFTSAVGKATTAIAAVELSGSFVGLEADWTDENGAVLYTYTFVDNGVVSVGSSDVVIGNGPSTLNISWDGIEGSAAQINVQLSAVPLPAGLVLLGSALGGLGLSRRRRKAA
ncbi:VPLPA-CTERM sorting domain-containing protein [Actibacterium lipolyticum]|uniref:VPLPA-CTERM sorting domain-containing protein n=1 Tax=Actibacterium lipolyticum TaxID=1524263 RepID=A0A238KV38_9RHOB|nr:VPLPA-CTERM sorting domain-containing protein [Actibacterium lipolyticum]SMX46471.1 hypothetical protein COL8621_03128 [Actibacterium lipolyticum]